MKKLFNWTFDSVKAIYNKWERLSDNGKMVYILRGFCLIALLLTIILICLSLID